MLIIGHKGSAESGHENSLDSLEAGYLSGSDMLEFDIRLTKDKIPILIHDSRLTRTHGSRHSVNRLMLDQLRTLTADKPIPTLEEVLDRFFGKILLNIELKSYGSGPVVLELIKKYIRRRADWDLVIISSFKGYELIKLRQLSKLVNLAMLHNENPFMFIAVHRFVKLTAVGFHRLYLNSLALQIAIRSDLFIYAYTVNRPGALRHLKEMGIEGVVTDYPSKLIDALDK